MKKCPKCHGEMIEGQNNDLGMYNANIGQMWKKTQAFLSWPAKSIKVITYACTKCGYLESYLKNNPK